MSGFCRLGMGFINLSNVDSVRAEYVKGSKPVTWKYTLFLIEGGPREISREDFFSFEYADAPQVAAALGTYILRHVRSLVADGMSTDFKEPVIAWAIGMSGHPAPVGTCFGIAYHDDDMALKFPDGSVKYKGDWFSTRCVFETSVLQRFGGADV